MNNLDKRNWAEQYEESVFAMKMEEYAEVEGKRLMEEYERALAEGTVSIIPPELDAKCRKLFANEFGRQRRQQDVRNFCKKAGKVAAAFIVMLSITVTLIMSADALRIPVKNFFMEQKARYTALFFDKNHEHIIHETDSIQERIAKFLPYEYELVGLSDNETLYHVRFENADGDSVIFSKYPATGEMLVDTEEAIASEMMIDGHNAIIIEKNGYDLYWIMENEIYYLSATNMAKDEFINLAKEISIV